MAERKKENRVCENLNFASKEAFKRLRNNIESAFAADGKKCPVIGITSAQPSEGKSTVAINLAYTLSEHGHRVILIDADLRRSSVHTKLGMRKAPGLSNLLIELGEISTCIQTYKSSKGSTSFAVLTSGEAPENPSELLDSLTMDKVLGILSEHYDYIILDLPPVGAVVDAVSIAPSIDGMLVVIRENNCSRSVLSDCVDQLEYAKANILGFVMNGALEGAGKRYQYSYY